MTKLWALALVLAGCAGSQDGSSPGRGSVAALSTAGGHTVAPAAFRLPVSGGPILVYDLPGLPEPPRSLRGRVVAPRVAVGFDAGGRRLIYRDDSGAVVTFDLLASREAVVVPRGALATLTADGVVLAVDERGAVLESEPWGTRSWPGVLGAGVVEVFGGPGSRLMAVRRAGADSLLFVSRDAGASAGVPLPGASQRSASRDGDAVALATDSGIVVVEDRAPSEPWFVRLRERPRAVAFSPSGHRLYAALGGRSELAVVDRFARQVRESIPLPGPAAALRLDAWGRAVLLRPERGDELWVVAAGTGQMRGRLATTWASDLPAVAADGTLLTRDGRDVVARELGTLSVTGRAAGSAEDLWVLGTWLPIPAAPVEIAAARSADSAAELGTEPSESWVQVSVSHNERWAEDLAAELTRAGHRARVVSARPGADGFRVVIGPFDSRQAADVAGRGLGRPFWIFQMPRAGAVGQ